jgi:tRNA 2-thiouridine synthesizing protein C
LYVNRRAPYGTIHAQESLETVLIGAAFEQDVSLLFLDDGVYQLKKEQDPSALEMKRFTAAFRALEMYDVEKLFVDADSLARRALAPEDLLVPVQLLSEEAVGELMEAQDVILSFWPMSIGTAKKMSVLHIVNKSPFETESLASCLRIARPGNGVLLIENAVYAAVRGTAVEPRVRSAVERLCVYALAPDLEARGLGNVELLEGIATVDYAGFVDLAAEHATVHSWTWGVAMPRGKLSGKAHPHFSQGRQRACANELKRLMYLGNW